MRAAEPVRQSRRVPLTISMMVGTPRPSSPTIHATVSSNSISDEAFDRLPSLSFKRWMRNVLAVPSSRNRGRKKHESPPGACARTRNASHMGADVNHLWPVSRYPSEVGSAVVVLVLTSDPPCFSVIPMPIKAPDFSSAGRNDGSYSVDSRRGSQTLLSSGAIRSVGTDEAVIEIGHPWPCSTCESRYIRLVLAT